MHWLLEYELVDDYLERRAALRPEHLEIAEAAHQRGDVLLAGALGDPPERAVLVFTGAEGAAAAAAFAEADPYVREGLVTSWTVTPWTVVIGG